MAGSAVNLVTADGTTHLNGLEVLNNAQVDGNLTVLGTITGVVELTQMQLITPITTVGNGTITAAALAGGFVLRTGPVAAFSDATDSAANIVAAFPGAVANSTIVVQVKNATAFMETFTAGSGVTLPPTVLNPPYSETSYLVTLTNVTTGSQAVTLAHLGTNAIVSAPSVSNPYSSALTTVGAGTIIAADFVGGFISRSGPVAAFTDTTDTATAIILALPSLVNKIGTSIQIQYTNTTAFLATIGGGVGVTVSGITAVPAGMTVTYLLTYTAAATLTMVGVDLESSLSTQTALAGSTSGQVVLQTAAIAGANTATLPALTDTIALGLSGINTAAMNIASTTTLATVPGLSVALTGSGNYAINGVLPVSGVTVSNGIKVALVGTNSLTATAASINGWVYSGTTLESLTTATALGTDVGSGNTCTVLNINGTIQVNAAGTLNLQAAQHTSTSLTTTIGAGGFISLTRIS